VLPDDDVGFSTVAKGPLEVAANPASKMDELLLRRSGKAADEACAMVADKLGYLPLALEQAAAYVAEQGPGFGFADYFRLYESHERAMLEDPAAGCAAQKFHLAPI
jgi:hypothetical protein